MRNLSTRGRILALIFIAALPAFALTVLGTIRERAAAEERAREDVQRLAQLAAGHQEQIVEAGRQVLSALAPLLPDLQRDRERCNAYFARVLRGTGGLYHSMGIQNADGTQFCNAIPAGGPVNVSDRSYFRLAMQTGKFAIGDYQVGRVTKKPGINFGYPITDDDGKITGVAFVALDLRNFNEGFSAMALPPYARLTILDRNGVVLARHPYEPAAVGKTLSIPLVLRTVLSGRRDVFEATGTDGRDRLFAYEGIAVNPDGAIPLRVLISIPKSIIYGEINRILVRNVLEIILATLLLLAGAWYVAGLLVLPHIKTVLGAAERIRGGDLSARTGLRSTRDELGQIGSAFDEMAQALQDRDAKLTQAVRDLHEQAITDTLTGLFNRRYLREVLLRELMKAKRNGTTVAAIMVDLDYFKKINDTFGHRAGDVVLREVGTLLKQSIRAADIACRYGGEEFALILPDASSEGAREKAEALREAIAALDLQHEGRPLPKFTASFGVAVYPAHADTPDTLLQAADEALYEAKGSGRNRVVVLSRARSR